jgi:hypothetical protein
MIEMLNKIYWFFSPFVSPEEKRIYKILHSQNPQVEIRSLMQSNIFKLCVYLEYFSKGYKRLNKNNRKQLYRSVDFLRVEFLKFLKESQYDRTNKLRFFELLKDFLHSSKRYEYQESTFLGGMQNPHKLVGDCNQIVTLYVYLWSLIFDVSELKIKLPSNHIVLSYKNTDIEATNGSITKNYSKLPSLDIIELITVNLLDVNDFREKVSQVKPRDTLKISELAFAISSNSEIVRKNLKIAQDNLALLYLKKNNFKEAIALFKLSSNEKMIENACSMAVEFFVAKKKFRKALKYASKNSKLIKFVRSNWVVKLVEKFKFKKAMKVSKGNSELVKFINQSEYKWILEKLPHEFDEKLIIKFQSKIQRAYTLADRLGDKQNKKLLSKLIR